MAESKYYFVIFDYERDFSEERKIVEATIKELHTFYYKNRSLIISPNALLVKQFQENIIYHNSVHHNVDSAFCEIVREQKYLFYDNIHFFALPIELDTIAYYANKFKKELDYIDSMDN